MKLIFISFFFVSTILIGTHGQIKRQAPGGYHEANDPQTYEEIKRLINNGVCEQEDCFNLVKINNVARQVVAGVNYIINGMFRDVESGAYYTLTLKIYHVVWENRTERTKKFKII